MLIVRGLERRTPVGRLPGRVEARRRERPSARRWSWSGAGEGTEIEVPDAGFRCERAVYRGVYGEVHRDLPLRGICLFGACDLRFCAPPRIRTENRRIKSPLPIFSAGHSSGLTCSFVSPPFSAVPPGLTSSRDLSTRLSTRHRRRRVIVTIAGVGGRGADACNSSSTAATGMTMWRPSCNRLVRRV